MARIRPIEDRLVVKPGEVVGTVGGIEIPATAQELPQEGVVVAAGPGRMTIQGTIIPMQVKVGDHVMYGRYTGVLTDINGTNYLLLRECDILGVFEEGDYPEGLLPPKIEVVKLI